VTNGNLGSILHRLATGFLVVLYFFFLFRICICLLPEWRINELIHLLQRKTDDAAKLAPVNNASAIGSQNAKFQLNLPEQK